MVPSNEKTIITRMTMVGSFGSCISVVTGRWSCSKVAGDCSWWGWCNRTVTTAASHDTLQLGPGLPLQSTNLNQKYQVIIFNLFIIFFSHRQPLNNYIEFSTTILGTPPAPTPEGGTADWRRNDWSRGPNNLDLQSCQSFASPTDRLVSLKTFRWHGFYLISSTLVFH